MDEIHDIHGLRLVVEKEVDCYKALDIVHHLWDQIPGRFKDYISHPKSNRYLLWTSYSGQYLMTVLKNLHVNKCFPFIDIHLSVIVWSH